MRAGPKGRSSVRFGVGLTVNSRPLGSPAPEILLLSLPFGPLRTPSLALGLLQACLQERGIPSETLYLTLDFARRFGMEAYLELTESWVQTPDEVGEWIFSEALNGGPGDVEGYLREVLREGHWAHRKSPSHRAPDLERFIEGVLRLRAGAGAFLDEWAERLVASGPRVVGFTSVFQQNAATLALAQRIKALRPEILTVMGGANAEGAMGEALFEAFPALDLVVSGEAEQSFPRAMEAFLQGRGIPAFPGYSVRPWLRSGEPVPGLPTLDLDTLPAPDYASFMDQVAASALDFQAHLPFETSRGCWWGEKQHCTFCGLNGQTMAYRAKAWDRALAEFRHLREAHPGCEISVVDNILDMTYFKTFLPALAAEGNATEIFFEVKANLTKDQLRVLKAAGVSSIQPGIESLSDPVLRLMRKGVRAIHCVQLLKWCVELGITPGWNLLGGFPGEDPAEYVRMTALLPSLFHLPAPFGCVKILLDRFSPNFNEAAERGLVDVQAFPASRFVHPGLSQETRNRLAYHLVFRYADGRDVFEYLGPLEDAAARWKAQRATLLALDQGERLMIFDTRPGAQPLGLVEGAGAWVLRACDGVTSRERLGAQARQAGISESELETALEALRAARYLMVDGDLCLTLPLGLGAPVPPSELLPAASLPLRLEPQPS